MQFERPRKLNTRRTTHYPRRNLTGSRKIKPGDKWDTLLKHALDDHHRIPLPPFVDNAPLVRLQLKKRAQDQQRYAATRNVQRALHALASFYREHDPEVFDYQLQRLRAHFSTRREEQDPLKEFVLLAQQSPEYVVSLMDTFGKQYNVESARHIAFAAASGWDTNAGPGERGAAARLAVASADLVTTPFTLPIGGVKGFSATFGPALAEVTMEQLERSSLVLQNRYVDGVALSVEQAINAQSAHQHVLRLEATIGKERAAAITNPDFKGEMTPEEDQYKRFIEQRNRHNQAARSMLHNTRDRVQQEERDALVDTMLNGVESFVGQARNKMYSMISPSLIAGVTALHSVTKDSDARNQMRITMSGTEVLNVDVVEPGQLLGTDVTLPGLHLPAGTRLTAEHIAALKEQDAEDLVISDPGVASQVASYAPGAVEGAMNLAGNTILANTVGNAMQLGRRDGFIHRIGGRLADAGPKSLRLKPWGTSTALFSKVGLMRFAKGSALSALVIEGGRGFYGAAEHLMSEQARARYEQGLARQAATISQRSMFSNIVNTVMSAPGYLLGGEELKFNVGLLTHRVFRGREVFEEYAEAGRLSEEQRQALYEGQRYLQFVSTAMEEAEKDLQYVLPGLDEQQRIELAQSLASRRHVIATMERTPSETPTDALFPHEGHAFVRELEQAKVDMTPEQRRLLSSIAHGVGVPAAASLFIDQDALRRTGNIVLNEQAWDIMATAAQEHRSLPDRFTTLDGQTVHFQRTQDDSAIAAVVEAYEDSQRFATTADELEGSFLSQTIVFDGNNMLPAGTPLNRDQAALIQELLENDALVLVTEGDQAFYVTGLGFQALQAANMLEDPQIGDLGEDGIAVADALPYQPTVRSGVYTVQGEVSTKASPRAQWEQEQEAAEDVEGKPGLGEIGGAIPQSTFGIVRQTRLMDQQRQQQLAEVQRAAAEDRQEEQRFKQRMAQMREQRNQRRRESDRAAEQRTARALGSSGVTPTPAPTASPVAETPQAGNVDTVSTDT